MKIDYFKSLFDFKEKQIFVDMNVEIFEILMNYIKGYIKKIPDKYFKEANFLGIEFNDNFCEKISNDYKEKYWVTYHGMEGYMINILIQIMKIIEIGQK